jgi:hypothetical protein
LREALKRAPRRVNEHLTGVQTLGQFTAEPRPLPPAVFDLLAGETLRVCGFAPGPQGGTAPALYVMDGRAAVYYAAPLPFLEATTIPSAICSEPASGRHWLTVGDSNHLFVLDERYQLVGDVFWPAEEQGLARVAFAAARNEAWVSAHSSVFVFDLKSLKLLGEIAAEPNLRWHCGARVRGFVGGLAFNATSTRALLARPLSGDVLEFDAASRRQVGAYPMTVDPLELACAHGKGRVYVQGLRSGAISWFTCHDI